MLRFSKAVTAVFLMSIMSLVYATDPVDSVVKNAIIDITRFEQQAQGLTAARKSNIRRILKLMELSYQRLQESPNKTHISWIEADQRYAQLQSQLQNLMQPSAKATGSKNQPAAQSSAGTNGQTGTTPENVTGAVAAPLVSGQRVRVKKLKRDIISVTDAIKTAGPSVLQNPAEVQKRKKQYEQFNTAIARYPQAEDPDVQAARAVFLKLREKLSKEFARAKQQLAELGDVQSRLKEIDDLLDKNKAPAAMDPPFNKTQVEQWLAAAGSARTVGEHSHKQLNAIAPLAYLPQNPGTPRSGSAYDADNVTQMIWIATSNLQAVQGNYTTMHENLKRRMQQVETVFSSRWQEKPDSDKRWLFLDERQQKEAYAAFDQAKEFADSYIYLESALNRDTSLGENLKQKADNARIEFDQKVEIALNTSRLPEPASTNAEMLAIAKSIIEIPKYEFGTYGPIILTTDQIVDRERKDSEIDIDDAEITLSGDVKLSGSQTTWTYAWKEFKFAVPLLTPENDTWHIWWITAKNFSSGGARTPLNKWVSGQATEGNRILKSNF